LRVTEVSINMHDTVEVRALHTDFRTKRVREVEARRVITRGLTDRGAGARDDERVKADRQRQDFLHVIGLPQPVLVLDQARVLLQLVKQHTLNVPLLPLRVGAGRAGEYGGQGTYQ